MNEEIMNEIQPVRPKDQFTFSCRQCGVCCRNIEGCVMVESLDAYCLARYLRAKGEPIEGIEDFLFRYCEPEPLTEEGFPIYMLKTKVPKAYKLLLKDLERIRAKLRRHIEKEAADREAEFEAAMQYHSESDIQEAYGWEFISEQQYEHYLELFRQGRRALDEHSPTVTELALSILNRIFQDIDRDCRQCEFEALSPEEQLAELKRAEESRQAWRQYIASLKEMINPSAAQE